MATYNILLMGASYGSLLASKLLFGGHSIHLVCLPAEADLINAEGFKVRLPVRGRKDPVLLESRKLPGKVTAGPAAGVDPKQYDLVGLCMQEPQYRSPGVRELLDAVAKSRVPCMSIMNMPPLPYVKRIPGLDYEALEPAYTDPTRLGLVRSEDDHAQQPRPAGDPSAGREGQRTAGHAADQLQMRQVRRRQEHGDPPPAREGRRRRALRHAGRQDRTAGEAQGLRLDLRAARQVGDAARRQLPLRHQGRHAHRARGGAQRHRDLALGLQLRVRPVRQARRQAGRSGAVREIRRRGAVADAAGFGGARAAERRAQYRARRQAGSAHRQAEGPEQSRRSTPRWRWSTRGSRPTARRRRRP